MASRRRAGMQGDPAVGIVHGPSSSSHTGSRITSSCCVQRSCNEKVHASRTGRHSGQREQLSLAHSIRLPLTTPRSPAALMVYIAILTSGSLV